MAQVNLIDAIVSASKNTPDEKAVHQGLSNDRNTLVLRGSQLTKPIVLVPDEGEQVVLEKHQQLLILMENSQDLGGNNEILAIEFTSSPRFEFINKGNLKILATSLLYSKQEIYSAIDLLEFTGNSAMNIVNEGSIVCKFTRPAKIIVNTSFYFFFHLVEPLGSGSLNFNNKGSLDISAKNLLISSNCEIFFVFLEEAFTFFGNTGFLNTGKITIQIQAKTIHNKNSLIIPLLLLDFSSSSPVDFVNRGSIEIDMDTINGRSRGLQIDSSQALKGTLKNFGTIISRQKYQTNSEDTRNNNSISIDFINTGFLNENGSKLILLNFSDSLPSTNANIRIGLTTITSENFQNNGIIYTGVDYQLHKQCISKPECAWFLIDKMYPVNIIASFSQAPAIFTNTGVIYLYSSLQVTGFDDVRPGTYKTIPAFRQKPVFITDGTTLPQQDIGSRPYLDLMRFQKNYRQYQLDKLCQCMFCALIHFNQVNLYHLPGI